MIEDIYRTQGFASHEPWVTFLIPDRGALAFDLGANTGVYAQELARRFAKVVACEPAVESFEYLTGCEEPEIVALNVAAADHNGELEAWVEANPMLSGQLVAEGSPDERSSRMVTCRTVDSLADEFGPPDFIKIDTEGFESQILAGAQETLYGRPQLLIEVHAHFAEESRDLACEKLLSSYGYDLTTVAHPGGWQDYYWLGAS